MNIVMLGHSGAGKTTYVSLMYQAMQRSTGGFTVRADKDKHHRQLLADADEILRGRYPDPTHQRTSYPLTLKYHDDDVMPFRWRDYRGGALNDRSTGADAAELHEDLVGADGIVLLVDAVKLNSDPRAARDIRRLTTLILPALEAREEVLTPLVIGVTKCDLVDLDGAGVLDRLFDPFEQLINAVGATRHIHGTLTPLACGPDPVNVAVPVLWALRFGVMGRAMRAHAAYETATAGAEHAYRNDTIADRIGSWWRDEPSWASIGDRQRGIALAELQILQPLIEPVDRLGALLDEINGF